ncbi:MAG: hypothetical protein R2911_10855 [Caldilineaceae bacterium]
MTVLETVQQLQQFTLAERIQVIELLLKWLKTELYQHESPRYSPKPFRACTFSLGEDIHVDRDELYTSMKTP